MRPQPPLLRSRTHKKLVDIKLDNYRPRDWDYQNPKHQVLPHFVLGRYKHRPPYFSERVYPNQKVYFSPAAYGRRELKPAIFRSYILSQISTLPGAVLVNEDQIHDDQYRQRRREEVKKRSESYINKILNDYGSNVENLPGSKKGKKEFYRSKTATNIHVVKDNDNDNNLETRKPEEEKNEEKVERIKVNLLKSPLRKRMEQRRKLGENNKK